MPRPIPLSAASHPDAHKGHAAQQGSSDAADADAAANADYLVDMTGQLANLAQRTGFDLLSYILSMARLEAELVRARLSPPLDQDQ